MSPLRLSDEQLRCVMDAVRHLRPRDRAAFLEIVASRLRDRIEVGDGDLHRAICSAVDETVERRLAWVG